MVTIGLEPTASLRPVKFTIAAVPPWRGGISPSLTALPPSLHPPPAAFGSAPHDVNDVLSLIGMFAAKAQDLVVLDRYNLSNSTRVGWLYRWDELLSTTYFQCFTIVFLVLSDQHPRHVFVFQKIHL
ncbi:MAG: hypothetical protein IKE15_04660, partial [Clostridia bacterium]|nr:hypothetical protein [Clostridia bacterium]